jgi:hypothetical protein
MKGDKRQIGETVRFSLIAARGQKKVSYDQWQWLMADTSKNLTGNGSAKTTVFVE